LIYDINPSHGRLKWIFINTSKEIPAFEKTSIHYSFCYDRHHFKKIKAFPATDHAAGAGIGVGKLPV